MSAVGHTFPLAMRSRSVIDRNRLFESLCHVAFLGTLPTVTQAVLSVLGKRPYKVSVDFFIFSSIVFCGIVSNSVLAFSQVVPPFAVPYLTLVIDHAARVASVYPACPCLQFIGP